MMGVLLFVGNYMISFDRLDSGSKERPHQRPTPLWYGDESAIGNSYSCSTSATALPLMFALASVNGYGMLSFFYSTA